MKSKQKNILYLIIAILCFSTFEVVSKTIMTTIQPLQLTFIRFLIGSLFLLPIAIVDLKKRKITLSFKDFIWLLLLGILNVCISMNMVQYAIKYIPASLAAVLFSSNPLYVSLLSAWILKEGLNKNKILGLAIGILGVIVAFGNMFSGKSAFLPLGVLLSISSAIIFSLYTVLGKKVTIKLGSLSYTSITSLLGSLVMLPFMLALGISPFAFNPIPILPQLIYLSVVVTGIAYYCYFKALETLDTSLGSMTFLVKPLLASLLAAVVLSEKITLNLIFGIILVLIGIYVVKLSVNRRIITNL